MTSPLDDGFTLRLSTAWQVAGASDRRTFATPLAVTVESSEPRHIADHMTRLDAVQALLGIAHAEKVRAFGGSVRLQAEQVWSGLWDTSLMASNAGDATHHFPNLGLQDIGGIDALASWVRLVLEHRRSVAPLIQHKLLQGQSPESRLLSTAAAMEAWVKAHRTQPWARRVRGEVLPAALVRRVHPSWDSWIGGNDWWLDRFWSAYNHVKHDPFDQLSPATVHALELSGRWLLTAVLLDECSGDHGPSRHLFEKSLTKIGHDLRAHWSEQRQAT